MPYPEAMETLIDSIGDFVRVRQLNIALAGVLTLVYLVYQYWGLLFMGQGRGEDDDECAESVRARRSRSRSCSRSRPRSNDDKMSADKTSRRGRKAHRRCPDCSLCNFER